MSPDPFDRLEDSIEKFEARVVASEAIADAGILALRNEISRFAEAWSGSPIGYHASLYFRGLQRPPPHLRFSREWGLMRGGQELWVEVSYLEVKTAVEDQAKADLATLKKEQLALEKDGKQILERLLIASSTFRGKDGFSSEEKLVEELEDFQWSVGWEDLAKHQLQGNYMSRDQEAMSQGIQGAPHLVYESQLVSVQSGYLAFHNFCKLGRRLIGQVRVKANGLPKKASISEKGERQLPFSGARGLLVAAIKGNEAPVAKKLEDIDFLVAKVHLHKQRLLEELPEFQRALIGRPPNAAAPLNFVPGDIAHALLNFREVQPEGSLLMDLDALVVDARRAMEFTLRMLMLRESLAGDLSFQNFLDQLDASYKGQRSGIANHVLSKPALKEYCDAQMGLLKFLEHQRTNSIHYALLNRVDSCRVALLYTDPAKTYPQAPDSAKVEVIVYNDDITRFATRVVALVEGFVTNALPK